MNAYGYGGGRRGLAEKACELSQIRSCRAAAMRQIKEPSLRRLAAWAPATMPSRSRRGKFSEHPRRESARGKAWA